jgi:ubiquinone/menaquinone biosynthesis C-methylase UbiE
MREFEKKEAKYEDAVAHRYNRDYHGYPLMQAHDENFACFVAENYHPGDRVLDLGCGSASLWHLWEENLEEPGSLIGVDLSEKMIEECKRLFPRGDFRVGSVFEIPVEAGGIDLIIASSVLHHIPDEHLPDAFKEMNRVLDEHGTIVGREPVSTGRLGDTPGWFSGALMSFRHMVYRLTHTREYPEPGIGNHHHAYDPKEFIKILKTFFSPKGFAFRHPVSSYVLRCNHPLVSKSVTLLDGWIKHSGGHEFYYRAVKNYCDASNVAYCIKQELKNNRDLCSKKEFLALLQKAAEIIEKEIGK